MKWQLSIASSVTKHTPVYNLTVRYETSSKEQKTLELSSPFTRWFDADGTFVAKPFQQWLASEIPIIGEVDPQNKPKESMPRPVTSGASEKEAQDEQQKYEAPKKLGSNGQTPGSTKSRKGKKASA